MKPLQWRTKQVGYPGLLRGILKRLQRRTEDEEMNDLSKMSVEDLKLRRANKETEMLIPESSFDELARRLKEAQKDAEQNKIYADALDHISRIAGMARVPTRRLDWIVARARHALSGKPYDRDALPQYPR